MACDRRNSEQYREQGSSLKMAVSTSGHSVTYHGYGGVKNGAHDTRKNGNILAYGGAPMMEYE